MKKLVSIAVINLVLLIIQFSLISLISNDGEKVWQANNERLQLEADNQILKQKIYTESSLTQIKNQADKNSLTPMKTEFWRTATVAQIIP